MITEEKIMSRLSFHIEQLRTYGMKSEKGKQSIVVMKELLTIIDEQEDIPSKESIQEKQILTSNRADLQVRSIVDDDAEASDSLLDF